MRTTRSATRLAAALAFVSLAPAASSESAAELAELKAQIAALQARVEQLERQQQTPPAPTAYASSASAPASKAPESLPEWVRRFEWKGDLRYRNETIDRDFAEKRNRDRIRLRAGFAARVNETLRVEVQAATAESFDARSSNQTLTNVNSRKPLDLDLAYAEWRPREHWKLTFGKMPLPWYTTPSFFFDKDVNPEGIALGWQHGPTGLFANAFYTQLAERSARADSNMAGAQLGWRYEVAKGVRLTLAAGYFDHSAVRGYNTVQDGAVDANAFGNSIATGAACRPGIATCIANDFDVYELSADISMSLAGKPFRVFTDYGRNTKADFSNAAIPSGLDTAWAAGLQWGRVTGARTWELGYIHQVTEKDSLFGQWIDSDFANGATDGDGGAIRFGYGLARNLRVNGTYFLNDLNNDVAGADGRGLDYRRLQIDLNMSF